MSTKKYLDSDGVIYLWTKIRNALNGKVGTEAGKGLSTNDYTNAEKAKVASAESQLTGLAAALEDLL